MAEKLLEIRHLSVRFGRRRKPFTAVDDVSFDIYRGETFGLVGSEMCIRDSLTAIYITHDLGVVANVAERICVMYGGDILEIGTAEEVFYDPQHPYTWALLSSLPQLGVKGEKLFAIRGTPPNLFGEIKGDPFAPRNPYALKIDYEERPPFFEVSPTHKARTWLLDPRAPKVERPEIIRKLSERRLTEHG